MMGSRIMRRKLVIATLSFCSFVVLYIMLKGTDSELYRSIATDAFQLAGFVIGAYIAGGSFQDSTVQKMKILTNAKDDPNGVAENIKPK